MEHVANVILTILLVIFVDAFILSILLFKRYQKSTERLIDTYERLIDTYESLIDTYEECIDDWNKDNEIITENDKENEDGTNS